MSQFLRISVMKTLIIRAQRLFIIFREERNVDMTVAENKFMNLKEKGIGRVVLASGSPRRLELLHRLVPAFTVMTSDAEEGIPEGTPPHLACMYNAFRKAMRVADQLAEAHPLEADELSAADQAESKETLPGMESGNADSGETLVIGADTIVFAERILGKPADEKEAFRTLQFLRGRTHQVLTGVALVTPDGRLRRVFYDCTEVTFSDYSDEAVREYIRSGEPMDKAGSYAIQGSWGSMVTNTEGSTYNVIGLPVEKLERELSSVDLR